MSAGGGAEARGDWIHEKWKEVVEFYLDFMDFYLDLIIIKGFLVTI